MFVREISSNKNESERERENMFLCTLFMYVCIYFSCI